MFVAEIRQPALAESPSQLEEKIWKPQEHFFLIKKCKSNRLSRLLTPGPLFSCQDRIPRQVRRMQPSKWQIPGPFYCQQHERRQTKSLILQKEISKRRIKQNVLHGHTRFFFTISHLTLYMKSLMFQHCDIILAHLLVFDVNDQGFNIDNT